MRMTEPRWLVALRADNHHIRCMDGGFLLDDAPLGILLRRARVPLHDVDILNDDPIAFGDHLQYFSLLAEGVPGNDHNGVVFVHMHDRFSFGLQDLRGK